MELFSLNNPEVTETADLKLKNYEIKSIKLGPKGANSEFSQLGLNLSEIKPKMLIQLMNTNERLRLDFFKFELYRLNQINPEALAEVFLEVNVNSKYLEEFIDFVFAQNTIVLLYNVIEFSSKTLFENQICLILKYLIGTDYKKNECIAAAEKLNEVQIQRLTTYSHFLQENGLEHSTAVLKIFLVSQLLRSKAHGNKDDYRKALLIELKKNVHKGASQESVVSQEVPVITYDCSAFVDLFYILIRLSDTSEFSQITLSHLGTVLDCFIFFHSKHLCDSSFIGKLHEIITNHKGLQSKIAQLSEVDEKSNKLKCYITSFLGIQQAIKLKETYTIKSHKGMLVDIIKI